MQTEIISVSIENVKVGDRVVMAGEGTIAGGSFVAPIVTVIEAPAPLHPGKSFESFLRVVNVDGNGNRRVFSGWRGADRVLVVEDVE